MLTPKKYTWNYSFIQSKKIQQNVKCFQVGLAEHEKMRELGLNQLEVLGKIDPGFPEWKGDILKHFSTAELNLARINLESGKIQRPEFLVQVFNYK